jgi:hypothetical protein
MSHPESSPTLLSNAPPVAGYRRHPPRRFVSRVSIPSFLRVSTGFSSTYLVTNPICSHAVGRPAWRSEHDVGDQPGFQGVKASPCRAYEAYLGQQRHQHRYVHPTLFAPTPIVGLRLPKTSPLPIREIPQPSTTQASRLLYPLPEGP